MATTVEASILATLVFLPGKSHGQRSLAGYSPWGITRVVHDWASQLPGSLSLHFIRACECLSVAQGHEGAPSPAT